LKNKNIIPSSSNLDKDDNTNNNNNNKYWRINNRLKYFDYNYTGLFITSLRRVIKKTLKVINIYNEASLINTL